MSVKEDRRAWDKFIDQVENLKKKPHVAVGVLGENSSGEDFGLVEYATANEFGTEANGGHVPERSFIRSTMDEMDGKLKKEMADEKINIIIGKTSIAKALGTFGEKITSAIKKKITDIQDPPNAPSTVKRKGSDNPLIDTGRMRQSIAWKIREKGSV